MEHKRQIIKADLREQERLAGLYEKKIDEFWREKQHKASTHREQGDDVLARRAVDRHLFGIADKDRLASLERRANKAST